MVSSLHRRTVIGGLAAAALACLAPLASAPAMARDTITVVATTGMIADAARQVGGERVNVKFPR